MIKNKLLSLSTITFFVLLFPIFSIAQELKPDLIITNVTTRTKTMQVRPTSRVPRDYTILEYIITVKNIGLASSSLPFYISSGKLDEEFNHYSNSELVNRDSALIPVGDSIDVIVIKAFSSFTNNANFMINDERVFHCGNRMTKIDEINTFNNTFNYVEAKK
jgi:hypothetical protein